MDGLAIYDTIFEVLTGGAGVLRTIPVGRFKDGLYEGLDDTEKSSRAIDAPVVEIMIPVVESHPATTDRESSKSIQQIEVEIRTVYHLGPKHMVHTSLRHAVKAQTLTDTDAIRQALEKVGNLRTSLSGDPTGIVSGVLRHQRTEHFRVQLESELPGLIEGLHTYHGAVQVAQATS